MLLLIGLDGLTYLQFLRLLRWLFTCITIFVAIPLALVNYSLNMGGDVSATSASGIASSATSQMSQQSKQNASSVLDNLQLFTAANIKDDKLWVHITFEIVITALVLAFGEPTPRIRLLTPSHRTFMVPRIARSLLGRRVSEPPQGVTLTYRNQGDIAFRSLMVTRFRIDRAAHAGQSEMTIAEAKQRVCRMLGIPERPSLSQGHSGNCAVMLNSKVLEDISQMVEDFMNHHDQFEKRIFRLIGKWKEPFRHLYENCLYRLWGKAKVDTSSQLVPA